jgi:membrane-associated HD superfamily phosphohydrolase
MTILTIRKGRSHMEKDTIIVLCVTAVAIVTLVGVFWTKTEGWGKYSSSTLILVLAVFISMILIVVGKLSESIFSNIIFAVVGYAGGLIGGSKTDNLTPTTG